MLPHCQLYFVVHPAKMPGVLSSHSKFSKDLKEQRSRRGSGATRTRVVEEVRERGERELMRWSGALRATRSQGSGTLLQGSLFGLGNAATDRDSLRRATVDRMHVRALLRLPVISKCRQSISAGNRLPWMSDSGLRLHNAGPSAHHICCSIPSASVASPW